MSKHRLEKAADSGYEVNDPVFAKLVQIRDDGKLSLSMKECDQDNGADLNTSKTRQLQNPDE